MRCHRTTTYALAMLVYGIAVPAGAAEGGKTALLPAEEQRFFSEVYSRMKNEYVETVDDKTLIRHCVQGMVNGVDPHSAYLDEAEIRDMTAGGQPRGGIGLELTMKDGVVQVVSAIDDTPAWRAGLQTGDTILRVDNADMQGRALGDVVKLLRGAPGAPVTLTVARSGRTQPLTFTVTRAEIRIHSVKTSSLGDGYAYIRITQFNTSAGKAFKDAARKLAADNGNPLKGVVLDLRSNPGGLLNAAIEVADALLDAGLILYTEGRAADAEMKFSATAGDVLQHAPLAVLVNGGTAAGSEVLAGALQDHKRAVILGSRTYGRASIQTIIRLPQGGALKLTTSRWRTPNGRVVQGVGIRPDTELAESATGPASLRLPLQQDPAVQKALAELRGKAGS